ncbi:hypothetical protein ACHAPT_002936 [Fusarium lateritium]
MAEIGSPAREPSTRGRGRGGRGRGGRGRGGGRGGSTAAMSKAAATKPGRGGSRRGRAKNFSDSRVQAAYERQRHLKHTYSVIAQALRPALSEFAERAIEEAIQHPEKCKHYNAFAPAILQLKKNLELKLEEHKQRLDKDLELAEHLFNADNYVAEQEFKNGFDEMEEQFYEGQENRLRILESLAKKGLPVDVADEQYEYKVISDEHFDNDFGIYECYKDGHLVPYPSRVEGTEMWQKARDAEAAIAAAAAAAPTKGRGRRGVNKRRAQEQPEGQPTPKKNTRSSASPAIPALAPAKGLLASAAEVEATPAGTPPESDSPPASPEPPALRNGVPPPAAIATAISKVQNVAKLSAREKSPPLPKGIGETDEYGFRIYNQRPSMREKGINSRILTPHQNYFEDWQIGFRDTTNDATKGHTRAKRGKYLETPNSNGFHFDIWCAGYDYSTLTPEDFDQDMIKLYGVHPRYGIILPDSVHPDIPKTPHVMPGKPVVYIANPSGRVSHASRSFLKTTNHRRSEDAPWRTKIGASMRRFCKLDEIQPDEIDVSEYVRSDEELRSKSLGTAIKELEARPVVSEVPSDAEEEEEEEEELTPQPEAGFTGLSVLTYASAFLEAQESNKAPKPTPKPARYDAIRDVFTDSKPAAAPEPDTGSSTGLDLLAELSSVVSTSNQPAPIREMAQVQDDIAAPESVMAYEPAPIHDPAPMHEPIVIQDQQAYHDVSVNGTAPAQVPHPAMHEVDPRSSLPRSNELPPVTPSQVPVDPRFGPVDVSQGYLPRAQPPMQPGGPVHGHSGETMPYPPIHEHAVPQHQPVRPSEYASHPAPGHPAQDQGGYLTHGGYPNPPNPDHRESHMAAGRPIDPGYPHRRMSGYATETPSYSRAYWSQPPPQGPPPGPSGAPVPPVSAPGPGPSHYHSPAPPAARIPFSHNASAEPLPPLRPPRGRNQSIQDETLLEPSLRSAGHGSMGGSYYPPGPPRNYHRGYPGPEQHAPLQPIATDRILPNPQTTGQGYITSPHQGFAHQALSPTYANPPPMPPHMAQSPQDNSQGLPNPAHRHRSTPSGSSDAGNKYRKLQPAPVPAHRAWPNKPELKTIPYDHKETGLAAALPSSGPTQIRGWNGGGSSSSTPSQQALPTKTSFKSVRFAAPLIGHPPLAPKSRNRKTVAQPRSILKTAKKTATQPADESMDDESMDESVDKPVKPARTPADTNGSDISKDNVLSDPEDNPHGRRLRPRKRKNNESEPAEADAQPATKKSRVTKSAKSKTTEQASSSAEAQPAAKKPRATKTAKAKKAAKKTAASSRVTDESPQNEEASTEASVPKET